MSSYYHEPLVYLAPDGLAELGVPPGSTVLVWPSQMRWAHIEDHGYDHGVLLNAAELGRLVPITPGPGSLEALRAAIGVPGHRPSAAADPPPPPPAPPARPPLRLLD